MISYQGDSGFSLGPGEVVRFVSRQHWFIFRDPFLFVFFVPFSFLSAIFFIDHWSEGIGPWIYLNQFLLWLSLISFCFGFLFFLWRFFIWWGSFYLVSNQRLVLVRRKGFFSKLRRETSLDMVQDVRVEIRGLQGALYGFGDVTVQISSQEGQLIFEKVGTPYVLQRIIMKEFNERHHSMTVAEN